MSVELPEPIPATPSTEDRFMMSFPTAMAVGGQPSGVTVVTRGPLHDNAKPGFVDDPTAAGTLARAFLTCLPGVAVGLDQTLPADTLRVVVAPKP